MKYKCIANYIDFKEGEIYGFRRNYVGGETTPWFSIESDELRIGLRQELLDKYFEPQFKQQLSTKTIAPQTGNCECIQDGTFLTKGITYQFIKTYDPFERKYWFTIDNLRLREDLFEQYFKPV